MPRIIVSSPLADGPIAPPPPPQKTTLFGVSNSNYTHGGFTNWQAVRVYKRGSVSDSWLNGWGSGLKVLQLTDEKGIDMTGGQASADLWQTWLENFWSDPAHADIGVHLSMGNEVDAQANLNVAGFVNTNEKMRPYVDQWQADGFDCQLGADFTQNNIRTNNTIGRFSGLIGLLDFIPWSAYPPGRQNDPPTVSATSLFIDPGFDVAEAWGVTKVEIWETGTGISVNYNRPAYVQTWIDACVQQSTSRGIDIPVMSWWDNWLGAASDPDDRFQTDGSATATVWRDGIAAMWN